MGRFTANTLIGLQEPGAKSSKDQTGPQVSGEQQQLRSRDVCWAQPQDLDKQLPKTRSGLGLGKAKSTGVLALWPRLSLRRNGRSTQRGRTAKISEEDALYSPVLGGNSKGFTESHSCE